MNLKSVIFELAKSGKLRIDAQTVLFLPDQTPYSGTIILGNGGGSLTHATGTEGQANTILGVNAALSLTTGFSNVATGSSALQNLSSGSYNLAFGGYALSGITSGAGNVGIGNAAGQNITTGTECICIGANTVTSDPASWAELVLANTIYGREIGYAGGRIGIMVIAPTARLHIAASNATYAALKIETSGAVLKTSPIAGEQEADANGISYYTHATGERAVNDAEQFVCLNANYTLTSQTALQKLFNATANGALTVSASKTYFFECNFDLTAMSATSGTFSFGFLGTATFSSIKYTAFGFKAAATAPAMTTGTAAAATVISLASTGTTGNATIRGVLRINAGGTIIPAVGLSVAAAAVVSSNSFFRIWAVGTNTVTSVGNWS